MWPYTEDGPPECPWECRPSPLLPRIFYIQRVGWDERNDRNYELPCELIFSSTFEDEAKTLTSFLNELDQLRKLRELAQSWDDAIVGSNGVDDAEKLVRAFLKTLGEHHD